MTRVDFGPMGARSAYLWPIGTAVMVLAMSAYFFATEAQSRPFTLFGPLLVAVGIFVVLRSKQWVEVTGDDAVLVQRRAFTTARVSLREARELYLRANGGGSAQVVAKGDGGTAFATLHMSSAYAEGYQRAEVLEALITGAERNRSKGAGEAVAVLRRQLEHVRAGAPARTAPLAAFARDGTAIIGAAGAAGAAGGLSDL